MPNSAKYYAELLRNTALRPHWLSSGPSVTKQWIEEEYVGVDKKILKRLVLRTVDPAKEMSKWKSTDFDFLNLLQIGYDMQDNMQFQPLCPLADIDNITKNID